MTQQQPYDVIRQYPHFDLRRYPSHVVAEILVNAAFDRAGNAAFPHLFNYISGSNTASGKLPMTAPVTQVAASPQKLAMTAPVLQSGPLTDGHHSADYVIAFVLPVGVTAATAPVPKDPDVQIREVAAALAAALRFTGRGSEAAFQRHNTNLQAALRVAGLTAVGPPRFARFDPPFKPWFLQSNEVVQEVLEPGSEPR
jgi:SOUL heme-binding protein